MREYPYPIVTDWQDEASYPFDENTQNTRWAWEFLRRNPDYQKNYDEYSEAGKNQDTRLFLSAKWNTLSFIYPRSDKIPGFRKITSFPQEPYRGPINDKTDPSLEERAPHELVLRFNLLLPYSDQERQARKIFQSLKELRNIPRNQPDSGKDLFKLYLRLLDAKASGAKPKQILNSIPMNDVNDLESALKDRLKAARILSKTGYYLLGLSDAHTDLISAQIS